MIPKKFGVRQRSPRSPTLREPPSSRLEVAAVGAFLSELPWACNDGLCHDKEDELHQRVIVEKEKEKERGTKWEFCEVDPFFHLVGQILENFEKKHSVIS